MYGDPYSIVKVFTSDKSERQEYKMVEGGKGIEEGAYFSGLLDQIKRNEISKTNSRSINDTSISSATAATTNTRQATTATSTNTRQTNCEEGYKKICYIYLNCDDTYSGAFKLHKACFYNCYV